MDATYFYVALVVGLCVSLLIDEVLGISTGGMIVPAYLAMICDDLQQMVLIFIVALAIYLIVGYLLPHFVILFGRRKFVATLIVGVILKLILELLFPALVPFAAVEIRGIGVITPSLIANGCSKQGFRYTIPAILIATYLTFFIVSVLFWIF